MTEPLKEPSVLDYVKSKLNPWQREKIEIPVQPGSETFVQAEESASKESESMLRGKTGLKLPAYRPWRTTLAIGAALFAQWTIEQAVKPIETQPLMLAIGAYFVAFGLLAWAALMNEFALPEAETVNAHKDPQTFHPLAFLASIVLAGLAFTQFGKNAQNQHVFNSTNLTLWLGSVGLFVYSLWWKDPQKPPLWQRALNVLKRDQWQITLTRSGLLLVVVIALVLCC